MKNMQGTEGSDSIEQGPAAEVSGGTTQGWRARWDCGAGGCDLRCEDHQGVRAVADRRLRGRDGASGATANRSELSSVLGVRGQPDQTKPIFNTAETCIHPYMPTPSGVRPRSNLSWTKDHDQRLWIISSLAMRCVVLVTRDMRELSLCDQSLSRGEDVCGRTVSGALSQLLPIILHQGGPAHQLHRGELLQKVPRNDGRNIHYCACQWNEKVDDQSEESKKLLSEAPEGPSEDHLPPENILGRRYKCKLSAENEGFYRSTLVHD
ncbi:hypothetical protein EYF80_035615 [Liparis tanakae]|uniref:Uncharacterized protein n=1 Tax=Liparis tanakae TaxID=230148 RepID=A0A4Z2GKX9_9TELE|nr:hypothetical protein EYF80_035615 [Liparis tanakae]